MSQYAKVQNALANMWGHERYGDDRTLHRTGELNVETDKDGKVVAVWFRCMALPFSQSFATRERAEEMRRMYEHKESPNTRAIVAVETQARGNVDEAAVSGRQPEASYPLENS